MGNNMGGMGGMPPGKGNPEDEKKKADRRKEECK
jgi:hypothetical protein